MSWPDAPRSIKSPRIERRTLHKQALTVLTEPPIDPDTLGGVGVSRRSGRRYRRGDPLRTRCRRAGGLHWARTGEAVELYALTLRHADAVAAEQRVIWLEQARVLRLSERDSATAAMSSWRRRRSLAPRRWRSDERGRGPALAVPRSWYRWAAPGEAIAVPHGIAAALLEDVGAVPAAGEVVGDDGRD